MKKTITLILAFLLLCFGLSACTDLKNNNDDNDGDGGNEKFLSDNCGKYTCGVFLLYGQYGKDCKNDCP